MGGEHTNKILHEGFLQHLRNEGKAGTPIHIWTPDSKAPISGMSTETRLTPDKVDKVIREIKEGTKDNGDEHKAVLAWGRKKKLLPAKSIDIQPEHLDALVTPLKDEIVQHEQKTGEQFKLPVPLPVHMRETYGDFPKEMGYKPGKYGEISTQDNEARVGTPTLKDTIKKRQFILNDLLKSEITPETQQLINASIESLNSNEGAQAIQTLQQSNPEAYEALMNLLHIVASHYEDSEEVAEKEQQGEGQPQVSGDVHVGHATKDEKIHGHREKFSPGAVRENPDHTARTKDSEGEWHQIGSRKSGAAPQEPNQ